MSVLAVLQRCRQPMVAVLGVSGIVVGSVAAFGTAASAAPATTTLDLSCVTTVGTNQNPFDWEDAEITFSATGPAGTAVTVQVSDMPPIAPVRMNNYPGTSEMVLSSGAATTTLTGSGPVTNSGPNEPVPVPDLSGQLAFQIDSLADVLTSLNVTVSGISTDCVLPSATPTTSPTTSTPTPTPTPTTTTSATATPSASTSAGADEGVPAEGTVDFACALTIGSEFDWKPTVSVAGYRESEGDPVSLVASMSDLPGIAPVVIDGPMDFTLDIEVGGEAVTLTSTGSVTAQPYDDVPVADLTGEVDVDGDELEVTVSAFTFDFASAGVGAECEADAVSLGTMTVGSEEIETDDSDDSSDSGSSGTSGGTSTTSGSLPQTGGGDAMPVVALWALALTLLGAAVLLCLPQPGSRKS